MDGLIDPVSVQDMPSGDELRRPRQSLARSFVVAWTGVREAWRSDRNLRIHGIVTVIVGLWSWWVGLTASEWAIILLTCGMVWTAELLNTAIEAVTDLASPDEHELARQAKDIASGAVLIAAIVAVAVGLLILGPATWERLSGR